MASCSPKLPPGPPKKPLLGNLTDVDGGKLHHSFTELSRKYGDLFTLHVSGKPTVVVNTIDAFRELYAEGNFGDSLCGRPKNFVTEYVYGEKDLPQSSNTPAYRVRREALYTSTQNVQQQQEEKLYDALGRAVDYVKTHSQTPQDLATVVELYLTSIYTMALTGDLYEYDDPRLRNVIERVNLIQQLILPKVTGVMTALPWLRGIPLGHGATYGKTQELFEKLKKTIFDPLKESYDPNVSRGGIDCLIRAQNEADPEMLGELTDDYLWESASSTIGAGTGVGIGLIVYFFVVILHQPEIADKVRAEIDRVIGRDRLATLADKSAMLYTQAALMELFRWVSPAPLLVPRRLDSDIQFREYTLPKDASVITNAWKINHDEATWDKPWDFDPQRFLAPDGQLQEELWKKNVVVFGGGRRQCIGQSLARDVSFLFLTSMLQKFTFEVPEGKELPPLDPHHSVRTSAGIKPAPFTVSVKIR